MLFEPRPHPEGALVWAIDEIHLPNYLLPRDCPRVTFAAGPRTTPADREKFGLGDRRVVAVEEGWREKIRRTVLYVYEMPPATFRCHDANAGYFVSSVAVRPLRSHAIENPLARTTAEVRFLPRLQALRDQVVASTLEFSVIRFRYAREREASILT